MKARNRKLKLPDLKIIVPTMAATVILTLAGCGSDSVPTAVDDHSDGHDHGLDSGTSPLAGRLLVVNPAAVQAQVFDLEGNDLITTIPLDSLPSAVYASGGYRFAALLERDAGSVGFIDGGIWQQAHDDHMDLYTTLPALLNSSLNDSRPTHFSPYGGQVAVFFDGNADTSSNASVQVFDDELIAAGDIPATLSFTMPMHGVAEPRGEHLLSSIRRDDSESTSGNYVLPDQVGVYTLHGGSYDLEQTFDVPCPDLHGAAQNKTHVVFGCSDGVLLATEGSNEVYTAQKLLNPDSILPDARIGSIWGHEASGQFIGQASAGDVMQFFTIDPKEEGNIELIDWQPVANSKPVARDFAYEAGQFVILDDQGYLTLIKPVEHGDHTHWEYAERLAITEADTSKLPEGMKFSMTLDQGGHTVYIADPIAQHIVVVDLDIPEITGKIELDFAPAMITWLGIPGN